LAETELDLAGLAIRALELFRRRPYFKQTTLKLPEPREAAPLTGDPGILSVAA
jgi:hypothetical protein